MLSSRVCAWSSRFNLPRGNQAVLWLLYLRQQEIQKKNNKQQQCEEFVDVVKQMLAAHNKELGDSAAFTRSLTPLIDTVEKQWQCSMQSDILKFIEYYQTKILNPVDQTLMSQTFLYIRIMILETLHFLALLITNIMLPLLYSTQVQQCIQTYLLPPMTLPMSQYIGHNQPSLSRGVPFHPSLISWFIMLYFLFITISLL